MKAPIDSVNVEHRPGRLTTVNLRLLIDGDTPYNDIWNHLQHGIVLTEFRIGDPAITKETKITLPAVGRKLFLDQ